VSTYVPRIESHRMSPSWVPLLEYVLQRLKSLAEAKRLWSAALAVLLLLWSGMAGAQDYKLNITQMTQIGGLYVPDEVCRITTDNVYRRGPAFATLSCMDFYGRIIGLAQAGQKGESWMQLYLCWALDPCGRPK
jgi:hypothetical protein